MTTSSKEIQAVLNRILATPKHLREFEETCALRTLPRQLNQALAAERAAAETVARIKLTTAAFNVLCATAEYAKLDVANRTSLLAAVSDLYLMLNARR